MRNRCTVGSKPAADAVDHLTVIHMHNHGVIAVAQSICPALDDLHHHTGIDTLDGPSP
jgi:hypothetical protein